MVGLRHSLVLLLLPAAGLPALAGGDPVIGEGVFANRCGECHVVSGDVVKKGPPLTGLFGRTSGTYPGFAYSDAMKAAGIVWGDDTLAAYLVNPKAVVPQNKMPFNGLKRPGEKEDLLAYLKVATAP